MRFPIKPMMALVLGFVMVIAVSCQIPGQPGPAGQGGQPSPQATGQTTTPIQHLVVIYNENNAFDHYFGTYPNALNPPGEPAFTAAANTPSVNGLTPQLLHNNPNLANPKRLDRSQPINCDQDHEYFDEQKAFDNGKMDKFVQNVGPACKDKGIVMDYYDGNTVTAFWNYAQHFAMSDNFFGSTFGPSAIGGLNLIAGQTHGATPASIPGLVANGTLIADARPLYDACSKGTLVSMSGQNVGDLLNAKNISWGWFNGGFTPSSTAGGKIVCGTSHTNVGGIKQADFIPHHDPFQFFKSTANPDHLPPTSAAMIGKTDQANHQYDLSNFWVAANAGNMPAVSFIKPPAYQDGNPKYSDPLDEQQFLTDTLNRLQQLPTWKNTAVIVTYDDSDGWYDHVMGPTISPSNDAAHDALNGPGMCGTSAPQQGAFEDRCGYGPRLPLLVISPFAKQNFVDHTITSQSSILRFIEDNWNLGRIGNQSFDATAGSLGNLFNFAGPVRTDTLILNTTTGELATGGPGSQGSPTTSATQANATIVTNADGTFAFTPQTLTVAVGTTVTWKNTTQIAHTVTSDDGTSFDSGAMAGDGTFSFTFSKPGTYTYHCDIHPYMKATVIVQ